MDDNNKTEVTPPPVKYPDWAKGIILIAAILAGSGGGAVYTSNTVTEKLARLDEQIKSIRAELGRDGQFIEEQTRIDNRIRTLVKPECLR